MAARAREATERASFLTTQIGELDKTVKAATQTIGGTEADLNSIRAEISALGDQTKELKTLGRGLTAAGAKLEHVTKLADQMTELRAELRAGKTGAEKTARDNENNKQTLAEIKSSLAETKKTSAQQADMVSKLNDNFKTSAADVDRQLKKIGTGLAELEGRAKTLSSLSEKGDEISARVEAAASNISSLESRLAEAEKVKKEIETLRTRVGATADGAKEAAAEGRAARDALTRLRGDAEKYRDDVTGVSEAARRTSKNLWPK